MKQHEKTGLGAEQLGVLRGSLFSLQPCPGQLSLPSSVLLMLASVLVAALNSQVLVDHLEDFRVTEIVRKTSRNTFCPCLFFKVFGETQPFFSPKSLA